MYREHGIMNLCVFINTLGIQDETYNHKDFTNDIVALSQQKCLQQMGWVKDLRSLSSQPHQSQIHEVVLNKLTKYQPVVLQYSQQPFGGQFRNKSNFQGYYPIILLFLHGFTP